MYILFILKEYHEVGNHFQYGIKIKNGILVLVFRKMESIVSQIKIILKHIESTYIVPILEHIIIKLTIFSNGHYFIIIFGTFI